VRPITLVAAFGPFTEVLGDGAVPARKDLSIACSSLTRGG
jgi:hypothetical protein